MTLFWKHMFLATFFLLLIISCSAFGQIPLRENNEVSHTRRTHQSPVPMQSTKEFDTHLKLEFGFSESIFESQALVASLLDTSSSARRDAVREISILGFAYPDDTHQLPSLFEKLTNLEILHWKAQEPIPPSIVQILERNSPSCQLNYTLNLSQDLRPEVRDRASPDDSVVKSSLLRALKVDIMYGGENNFADLSLVFKILTTCPNLRSLELSIHHHGCVVGGWTPYAFDFRSNPNTKFPPLEVLKLDGYDLDEDSDGGYAWYFDDAPLFNWTAFYEEELEPPPRPVRKESDRRSNLDCWLDAMDWSQLHNLELKSSSLSTATIAKLQGGLLPKLRYVAFSKGNASDEELGEAVERFLGTTLLPLECISIQNIVPSDSLMQVIADRHPQGLRDITVGNSAGTLPVGKSGIEKLMSTCNKLHTISVNLPRPELGRLGWDYDTLDHFAKAPELEHLILRFPSPDHDIYKGYYGNADKITADGVWRNFQKFGGEGDIPDPHISTASIEQLFTELRGRTKNESDEGSKMKKLSVYVGEWERRHEFILFGGGGWLRVGHWECALDKEGAEGCVGGQTSNDV